MGSLLPAGWAIPRGSHRHLIYIRQKGGRQLLPNLSLSDGNVAFPIADFHVEIIVEKISTSSVIALWQRYRASNPDIPSDPPPAEHFCDNKEDAERCASLVLTGRKRATASALREYDSAGEPIPEPGKLVIITDWSGEAKALIKTKRVAVCRFGDLPASFAALEGEGDGSLAWWRDEHRSFWNQASAITGEVDDNFQVVCEEFEVLLIA